MFLAMQFYWRKHEVQMHFFPCLDRLVWVQRNRILQLSCPSHRASGTGSERLVMWRHAKRELQRDKSLLIWIFHSYFVSSLFRILRSFYTTIPNQNLIQEEIKKWLNSGNASYHSVQNLLSAHLLSKNIRIRTYKTVILTLVLYGCETWSLSLREKHWLRVLECAEENNWSEERWSWGRLEKAP
jgi:hypothetical protein